MRLPIVMILAVLVVNTAVDYYIWRSLRRYSKGRLWPRIYLVFAAL